MASIKSAVEGRVAIVLDREPVLEDLSFGDAVKDIDVSDLAYFLAHSPKQPPREELRPLLCYLEKAFSRVTCSSSSVRYPWPMDQLVDVVDHPFNQVSASVYRAAAIFIEKYDDRILSTFIIKSFRFLITCAEKESRIPHQPHLAVFVASSIVLRWWNKVKRAAFVYSLPILATMHPFTVHDKLPILVWMIAQVATKDIPLALFAWARNVLPLANNKDLPEMDLILQLVEFIVSDPNAHTVLVKDSVQEGITRLITPSSFKTLLRFTFPASSERSKVTERFDAFYPLLKEVALADTASNEAMKQITLEIFTICLKLAGKGNPVLAKEATSIAIWSVSKNVDCCNHWDILYNKNPQASVALLRKLLDELKDPSHKLSSSPSHTLTLSETMNSFMLKNQSNHPN